jgi:hypothetical protein
MLPSRNSNNLQKFLPLKLAVDNTAAVEAKQAALRAANKLAAEKILLSIKSQLDASSVTRVTHDTVR